VVRHHVVERETLQGVSLALEIRLVGVAGEKAVAEELIHETEGVVFILLLRAFEVVDDTGELFRIPLGVQKCIREDGETGR